MCEDLPRHRILVVSMGVGQDSVQEFVDYVVGKYEEQTVLDGVVDVEPYNSQQAVFEECEEETSMEGDQVGTGVGHATTDEFIRRITACEESKFLQGLEMEDGAEADIGSDFGRELLNEGLSSLRTPVQLFLPDQPGYRRVLASEYDISDRIRYNPDVFIRWFNPSFFPNTGFLINDRVAVIQKEQDGIPVVADDLDADQLQQDNSGNRLRIHLGDGGFGRVSIRIWSEFSRPQTFDDESIAVLNLPDSSTL